MKKPQEEHIQVLTVFLSKGHNSGNFNFHLFVISDCILICFGKMTKHFKKSHYLKKSAQVWNTRYLLSKTKGRNAYWFKNYTLNSVSLIILFSLRWNSHNIKITFFFFFKLWCVAFRISVPQSGIEPEACQWEHWILTTGPPGISYN